jgi:uncharacterized pyridoxamine 5'-phosphate oxidase family protein
MKKYILIFVLLVLSSCVMTSATNKKNTKSILNNKKIKVKNMSNTDKVVKFLQEAKTFYIATMDGDQARVRPFGVAANIDGRVSICTSSQKNVYKQIQKNPKVEISAMTGDGKWIRLYGSLVDNTTTDGQNKIFEVAPNLKNMYKDSLDAFRVLSFKSGGAIIQDYSGYREEIKLE